MFRLIVLSVTWALVAGSPIPDTSTMDSCMSRQIEINDRNVRKAIQFFRGCRNLGLTMGELLPDDYMRHLSEQLKKANLLFLRQTTLTQPRLRILEQELNDLYQEITILSEKVIPAVKQATRQPPTTTTAPTTTRPTTKCTTSPTTTVKCSLSPDEGSKVDPFFDYDYGSAITPYSDAALFGFLLIISLITLVVTLVTCRIANKTYKTIQDFQEEEAQPEKERRSTKHSN